MTIPDNGELLSQMAHTLDAIETAIVGDDRLGAKGLARRISDIEVHEVDHDDRQRGSFKRLWNALEKVDRRVSRIFWTAAGGAGVGGAAIAVVIWALTSATNGGTP